MGGLTFAAGEVGSAFNFDGVDDQVIVADAPSLNFGANQDFSIEAWIQPQVSTTTYDLMTIMDKRNAPDVIHGIGYEIALTGGRMECRISDSILNIGTSFGAAGPDLRDGGFHHVAVTISRNSTNGGHYYVDGVAVLTFDPTVEPGDLSNDQPLRIGSHPTPSVFAQFKGKIDEVSIYQRALGAAEIQSLYAAGSGGKCVTTNLPCVAPAAGLVGWWRGESNADDWAGANAGVLQNGLGFASGEVGQGFSLDGVNDFISVPLSASLNVGDGCQGSRLNVG
ncbi:MAG: LamG domain-containing protein [Verrucomicrobiota bacterium]